MSPTKAKKAIERTKFKRIMRGKAQCIPGQIETDEIKAGPSIDFRTALLLQILLFSENTRYKAMRKTGVIITPT